MTLITVYQLLRLNWEILLVLFCGYQTCLHVDFKNPSMVGHSLEIMLKYVLNKIVMDDTI